MRAAGDQDGVGLCWKALQEGWMSDRASTEAGRRVCDQANSVSNDEVSSEGVRLTGLSY